MTRTPRDRDTGGAASRQAKLDAIASIFGEAMASRLAGTNGAVAPRGTSKADDDDRLSWQKNRLIQHLRHRVEEPLRPSVADTGANGVHASPEVVGQDAASNEPGAAIRLSRLPALTAEDDLSAEHPAVIAHILRRETQATRVSILRALPGQTARAVMQRLRNPV